MKASNHHPFGAAVFKTVWGANPGTLRKLYLEAIVQTESDAICGYVTAHGFNAAIASVDLPVGVQVIGHTYAGIPQCLWLVVRCCEGIEAVASASKNIGRDWAQRISSDHVGKYGLTAALSFSLGGKVGKRFYSEKAVKSIAYRSRSAPLGIIECSTLSCSCSTDIDSGLSRSFSGKSADSKSSGKSNTSLDHLVLHV